MLKCVKKLRNKPVLLSISIREEIMAAHSVSVVQDSHRENSFVIYPVFYDNEQPPNTDAKQFGNLGDNL